MDSLLSAWCQHTDGVEKDDRCPPSYYFRKNQVKDKFPNVPRKRTKICFRTRTMESFLRTPNTQTLLEENTGMPNRLRKPKLSVGRAKHCKPLENISHRQRGDLHLRGIKPTMD